MCRAGLPVVLGRAGEAQGELGGEGEGAAVGDLEVVARGCDWRLGLPMTWAVTEKGSQLVGLRVKLGRLS